MTDKWHSCNLALFYNSHRIKEKTLKLRTAKIKQAELVSSGFGNMHHRSSNKLEGVIENSAMKNLMNFEKS